MQKWAEIEKYRSSRTVEVQVRMYWIWQRKNVAKVFSLSFIGGMQYIKIIYFEIGKRSNSSFTTQCYNWSSLHQLFNETTSQRTKSYFVQLWTMELHGADKTDTNPTSTPVVLSYQLHQSIEYYLLRILLKQNTALLSHMCQLVCHRRDISRFLDNLIVQTM